MLEKDDFMEELDDIDTDLVKDKVKKIGQYGKKLFVALIVITALAFATVYKIKYEAVSHELEKLQEKLIELQDDTITVTIIEEKLDEIAELATAVFDYSGIITKDNYREFFKTDINIPFTKNEVKITYKGVIKVGYDLDELEYKIDESSKKIYISLPEVKVTDHYMILDELKFEQKNNILNPISVEEINKYLINVEKEELVRAEKEGIYKLAEEKIQGIIENYFAEFDGYKVVFM